MFEVGQKFIPFIHIGGKFVISWNGNENSLFIVCLGVGIRLCCLEGRENPLFITILFVLHMGRRKFGFLFFEGARKFVVPKSARILIICSWDWARKPIFCFREGHGTSFFVVHNSQKFIPEWFLKRVLEFMRGTTMIRLAAMKWA